MCWLVRAISHVSERPHISIKEMSINVRIQKILLRIEFVHQEIRVNWPGNKLRPPRCKGCLMALRNGKLTTLLHL
jgi:hypothetical protein